MALSPIGNVLTPSGFQAQSAQGVVLLQWQSTPLVLSYYVLRSTDNATFTSIGYTAGLSYNDLTAVTGTIYYYQLQAYNGSYYSYPTPSVSAQALLPGQTTVGNLILEAQQRSNMENNPIITTQEWTSMISQSYKELYDILVQKFGDDYFVAPPVTYTTTGIIDPTYNAQVFPLPNDFYKGLGVEVALNPGDPNSWVTLRKFEFIQRNLWNFPNVYTFYGITNLRYRFEGTNLYIVPIASANQTLRVWYAPRPSQLINPTDTVDAISGWEEYIVVDCVIKALIKQEFDISVFAAQKMALMKRIEEAAENRDIGEPEVVSDSKLRNFAWSDDSWNGGNPW